MSLTDVTLIVMAAGIGTRYGGLKQIEPVGPHGETLLGYSIYDALLVGFQRIVFVISRNMEDTFCRKVNQSIGRHCDVAYVIQELDNIPENIKIPSDRQKPWGTGHAILHCKHLVGAPFAVINADDFYGRTSFRILWDYLSGIEDCVESTEYCLVVFWLGKTLTDHGHVARAICRLDSEGHIAGLDERTHIERFEQSIKYLQDGGSWVGIQADTPVSMNMWGFTPTLFPELERLFDKFLKEHRADLLQAEFFLPEVVNSLIMENKATVMGLPTGERWFGTTYRADGPLVKLAIEDLIQKGDYPEQLWE
ncbi:MAG: hypothetical protein MUO58_15200 [Anaerolineales bacterium]|nr:hypothetical protein [Anaerolineales bacterium]